MRWYSSFLQASSNISILIWFSIQGFIPCKCFLVQYTEIFTVLDYNLIHTVQRKGARNQNYLHCGKHVDGIQLKWNDSIISPCDIHLASSKKLLTGSVNLIFQINQLPFFFLILLWLKTPILRRQKWSRGKTWEIRTI